MKSAIESYVRLLAGFGVLFGVGFGVLRSWKYVEEKLPDTFVPTLLLVGASSILAASCAFFVFYSRLSLMWMSLLAILSWLGVAWCVTR